MSTYKPNVPEGFTSEKDLYEKLNHWKKQQIFEQLQGKYPQDYYMMVRLNLLQNGRQ